MKWLNKRYENIRNFGLIALTILFGQQPVNAQVGSACENLPYWEASSSGRDCSWGYSYKGEWTIQPQFEYAERFTNDYAIVTVNNKQGLIDCFGKFRLQPVFDKLEWVDETKLIFSLGNRYGLIHTNGDTLLKPVFASLHQPASWNKYVTTRSTYLVYHLPGNFLVGIIDTAGRLITEARYGTIKAVGIRNYWEFSKPVDSAFSAAHRMGSRYLHNGIVDAHGHEIVAPGIYSSVAPFISNSRLFFYACKTNSIPVKLATGDECDYGILDAHGDEIIPFRYRGKEIVYDDGYNVCIQLYRHEKVGKGTEYRYDVFDLNGRMLAESAKKTKSMSQGLAVFTDRNAGYIIRSRDSVLVKDSFDGMQLLNFHGLNVGETEYHEFENFITTKRNGKWALMNNKMQYVLPYDYDSIYIEHTNFVSVKSGKLFLLRHDLKPRNSIGYDSFDKLNKRYHKARQDGFMLILDTGFKVLRRLKFDDVYAGFEIYTDGDETIDQLEKSNRLAGRKGDTLYYITRGLLFSHTNLATSSTFTYFPYGEAYAAGESIYYRNVKFMIVGSNGKILLDDYVVDDWVNQRAEVYDNDSRQPDLLPASMLNKNTFRYRSAGGSDELFNLNHDTIVKYPGLIPLYSKYDRGADTVKYKRFGKEQTLMLKKLLGYTYDVGPLMLLDAAMKPVNHSFYHEATVIGNMVLARKSGQAIGYGQRSQAYATLFDSKFRPIFSTADSLNDIDFISDTLFRAYGRKGEVVAAYSVRNGSVKRLAYDDLSFQYNTNLFWGRKNGSWGIYDGAGRCIAVVPVKFPGHFYFGLAYCDGNFIISNDGTVLVPYQAKNAYRLVKQVTSHLSPNICSAASSEYPDVKNVGHCRLEFTKYCSARGGETSTYLLTPATHSAKFVDAVNLAILSYYPSGFGNARITIAKRSDSLFNLTVSYEWNKHEPHSYLLMGDSMFTLKRHSWLEQLRFESLEAFNLLYFEKVKQIPGANWEACLLPHKAYDYFSSGFELHESSVVFYLENIQVAGSSVTQSISFSYADLEPFLDHGKVLWRWLHKQ